MSTEPPRLAGLLGLAIGVSLAVFAPFLMSCATVTTQRVVVSTAEPGRSEIQGARWPKLPVHYCVLPGGNGFVSDQKFRELTDKAFATWGLDSVDDGDCAGLTQGDRSNEIAWSPAPQSPTDGAYEAGYTRLSYLSCPRSCSGGAGYEIVEADILIDPTPPRRSQECLFTALLHEVGHFWGLPHLGPGTVMAPVSTECRQQLTQADRDALAALYSSNGAP